MIREEEIDHDRAREAPETAEGSPSTWRILLTWRLAALLASFFLFHFANAAMLPLVGQKVSAGRPDDAAALMSACIVAAQIVMVAVASAAAWGAERWGRKPVFLIAFAVLPIRGLLYTYSTAPAFLVAVQLLDGIGAGIYGVVGVLAISDVSRGSGRFNLALGAMATAAGLGAASSNMITGFVAEAWGFDAGFRFLSATAIVGLAWFAISFRETWTSADIRSEPSEANDPG